MGKEREKFCNSGPSYLKDINWQNPGHRRVIAASLVRGTYIHERDRQKNRTLAPPWWDFFNFELYRTLEDTKDGSYFGAIYKFKSPEQYPSSSSSSSSSNNNNYEPPRYVIAFRGTLIRRKTFKRDLMIDLLIIFNEIHHSMRFKKAMDDVSFMIGEAAEEGITANMMWLVGHSLGASLALAVGKRMAKKNFHLETYLFNSPFSAIPLEIITNNPAMKDLVRFVKNGTTAGLSKLIDRFRSTPRPTEDVEDLSAGWIPHIFVNRDDFICAEYIGFFKHREKLFSMGANTIAKLSNQHSLVSLISIVCGRDPEPSYLLRSAYVITSPSSSGSRHHQLEQWWNPNLDCEPVLYQYNELEGGDRGD